MGDYFEPLDDFVCLDCNAHCTLMEKIKVRYCKWCDTHFEYNHKDECPSCGEKEYIKYIADEGCPKCFSGRVAQILLAKP